MFHARPSTSDTVRICNSRIELIVDKFAGTFIMCADYLVNKLNAIRNDSCIPIETHNVTTMNTIWWDYISSITTTS